MWLKIKNHFFTGRILYFYLFYFILTLLVAQNAFFWDTIQLASKHARFYYNNNLALAYLPDSIDSGHLPAFGYLLAVTWKLFGCSLLISHLFMLPFLFGLVYQVFRLCRFFFPGREKFPMILLLADPTLLAQSTLVSPDIPLMFFMLLLLNGILTNEKWLKIIAVIGLSLVSMRAWMVAFLLFIVDIILTFPDNKKLLPSVFRKTLVYIPGGAIASLFLLGHYLAKGWIAYHPDSPWAVCFEKVNLAGFIYNCGLYAWRLIDFGRIVWWILGFVFLKQIISIFKTDDKLKLIVILAALFVFILPINMLMHKYLVNHRYFMPTYFFFSLIPIYLFYKLNRKYLFGIALIILCAGNLIVYPANIAQGWDSTLAHIPYFELRKETISYIKQNNIQFEDVKSWFPNLASEKDIDLTGSENSFSKKTLDKCRYCLYSNIFNDVTKEEYQELFNNWEPVYSKKCFNIVMIVFKSPKDELSTTMNKIKDKYRDKNLYIND